MLTRGAVTHDVENTTVGLGCALLCSVVARLGNGKKDNMLSRALCLKSGFVALPIVFFKVETCFWKWMLVVSVVGSVCNGSTQGIYTKMASRCRLRLQKLPGKAVESLTGLNMRRSKFCHSREPCLMLCHAIALETARALDLPPKCDKRTMAKQCWDTLWVWNDFNGVLLLISEKPGLWTCGVCTDPLTAPAWTQHVDLSAAVTEARDFSQRNKLRRHVCDTTSWS